MEVRSLLPIGSVVLITGAEKKLMIIGIKQTNVETNKEYDYLGVLYPEGNLDGNTQVLFNHDDIETIFFTGYENEERDIFIESLAQFFDDLQKQEEDSVETLEDVQEEM